MSAMNSQVLKDYQANGEALSQLDILNAWEKFFERRRDPDPKAAAENLLAEIIEGARSNAQQVKLWGELLTPQFFKFGTEKEFLSKVEKIQEILAQEELDKDYIDNNFKTSLDYALEAQEFSLALVLVECGVLRCRNFNLRNAAGETLFDYAVNIRNISCIIKLMPLVNVSDDNLKVFSTIQSEAFIAAITSSAQRTDLIENFDSFSRFSIQLNAIEILIAEELKKRRIKKNADWKIIHEKVSKCLSRFQTINDDSVKLVEDADSGKVKTFPTIARDFRGQYDACMIKVKEVRNQIAHMVNNTQLIIEQIQWALGVVPKLVGENGESFPPNFPLTFALMKIDVKYEEETKQINELLATLKSNARDAVEKHFNPHRKAQIEIIKDIKAILTKFDPQYYRSLKRFCSDPVSKKIIITPKSTENYLQHVIKEFDDNAAKLRKYWAKKVEENAALSPILTGFDGRVKDSKRIFLTTIQEVRDAREDTTHGFNFIYMTKFILFDTIEVLAPLLKLSEVELLRLSGKKDENASEKAAQNAQLTQTVSNIAEVLERDRKTNKALQQKQREEEKLRLEKEKLADERAKTEALEKMRLEQKNAAQKTALITAIKTLKQEMELLKQILTKGSHNNIQEADMRTLFGPEDNPKLPPFKMKATAKGFMITLNEKPVTTWDRQHGGKALNEKLFNEVRAAFESLDINSGYVERLAVEQRQLQVQAAADVQTLSAAKPQKP